MNRSEEEPSSRRDAEVRRFAEQCAAYLKVNPQERGTSRLCEALRQDLKPSVPEVHVRAGAGDSRVVHSKGR